MKGTRKQPYWSSKQPYWTKEKLLSLGNKICQEKGYIPTLKEWYKLPGTPSQPVFQRLFGSYTNFLKACNFKGQWRPSKKSKIRKLPKYLRWYLAGILDSDGHVGVKSKNSWTMKITNCDTEWLERIKTLISGGMIHLQEKCSEKNFKHRDHYVLLFNTLESYHLAKQIVDICVVKKERLQQLIKSWEQI